MSRYLIVFAALFCISSAHGQSLEEHYSTMVDRIINSLQPAQNETVIIRYDEMVLPGLANQLEEQISGKVSRVSNWPYGPIANFTEELNKSDIYIMLPVRRTVPVQSEQVSALIDWLDSGRGRQIHFHWGDGTRFWDSTHGTHNAVYDSIYLTALDIDYEALRAKQEKVSEMLRSGKVSVTSPRGTNLEFELGDRPITMQDGDASSERMQNARARIEREIELPAGAIRVAPVEKSVNGTLFIGTGTVAGIQVKDFKLTFLKGIIVNVEAAKGKAEFESLLRTQRGLGYFREIGIGFNPKLRIPQGYEEIPYYGYGSGVVRLSLGNNIELGGEVKGQGVQWMFFLDTTVKVGDQFIVKDGELVID